MLTIYGGALVSMIIPLFVWLNPKSLTFLFWGWIILFDSPHMWATYSRTFAEPSYFKKHKKFLTVSLIVFLIPITVLIIQNWIPSSIDYFVALASMAAFWHIIRQHYGYLVIYEMKSGIKPEEARINKWLIYLGLWIPFIFFVIAIPFNRQVMGLKPFSKTETHIALFIMAGITAGVAACCLWRFFINKVNRQVYSFMLTCIICYAFTFFVIAPYEPFFPEARTSVQYFMLVAIMMTMFHDIQYHGLVYKFNKKNNYKAGRLSFYIPACLIFSGIYSYFLYSSTEYPSFSGEVMKVELMAIPFCIWWGFTLHHYYLDQYIWRFSKSKELTATVMELADA